MTSTLYTFRHIQYKHFTTFMFLLHQTQNHQTQKLFTSIHKCRCAHGINTARAQNFSLLEYPLCIHFTAINHPVITHTAYISQQIFFHTCTYTYYKHLHSLWTAGCTELCSIYSMRSQCCQCIKTKNCLCLLPL